MRLELHDPRHDREPVGWEDFRLGEGLPAIWSYPFIRSAQECSWAPAVLGVFRDRGRVVGVLGALYLRPGSRRPPRPRRGPLVLDVRLPGHGYGPSWQFAAGVTDADRRSLFREFERAAARHLGWGLGGVVYRNLGAADVGPLARHGAVVRDGSGSAEMALRWDSLDGWLLSLRKSRRADLRRQVRMIDADPDLVVSAGGLRTDLDPAEMAELSRRHRERLQRRFDRRAPLPAAHFAELLSRSDTTVLSYVGGDGRLLAFGTLLHHPVRPLLGWWASLHPAEGGRKHLYFDHYVRFVDLAISAGANVLAAGQGSLENKIDLGFAEVPLKLVVVPRWAMG